MPWDDERGQGFTEIVREFEQLTELVPAASRDLIFGCPSCLLGDYLFFGCHPLGLFVRLVGDAGAELITAGGSSFEPLSGQPMTGFYVLGQDPGDHASWVLRAYEQAQLSASEPSGWPTDPPSPPMASGGTESSLRGVRTSRRPARLTNDPPQC